MSARTPAWHAVPDAVGVTGQWRPADLRGLPATLRYGAGLSGVALAAARGRPRKVLLVDDDGPVDGVALEAAVDAVAADIAAAVRADPRREVALCADDHRGVLAALTATGALGVDVLLVPPRAGRQVMAEALAGVAVALVDTTTAAVVQDLLPEAVTIDVRAASHRSPGRSLRSVPRPRRAGVVRLLTSGTTGPPRATERGTAGLGQLATLISLMRALDLRRDEPVVVAPSVAHGHGLAVLTAALVVGAPAVLGHRRAGDELLQLVRTHRAGVLAVVPAQLADALDALDAPAGGVAASPPPASLRRVASGSAPLSAEVVARTRALLGEVLVDFYGSSEVGTATIATADDLREAPGTVGRPAAGVRVDVVDASGAPVPTGVVGQVRVTSPWRAGSTPVGQVAIGDRGRLDDAGRLFLHGREADGVDVGGHLVPVERVRAWFAAQPGVGDVRVDVVDHPTLGHELVARVDGDVDLAAVRERALLELGSALAPRRVEPLAAPDGTS